MQSKIALTLAAIALGTSAVTLAVTSSGTNEPNALQGEEVDLSDIHARLDRIEQRIDEVSNHSPQPVKSKIPATQSVDTRVAALEDQMRALDNVLLDLATGEDSASATASANNSESDSGSGVDAFRMANTLDRQVSSAIDRKLQSLERRKNKKPHFDVFVDELKLSETQAAAVESAIVQGQNEIAALLSKPTTNGRDLMEELVEALALSQTPGRQAEGKELWKVFAEGAKAELVPGTNKTYSEMIESSKQVVRDSFKREMSEDQYKDFENWRLDPTQIESVPGTPYAAVMERVQTRKQELAAKGG